MLNQLGLGTLRILGPDCRGIVAASSDLLNRHGCGIVQSEHYTDRSKNLFIQRILFKYDNRTIKTDAYQQGIVHHELQDISKRFNLTCDLDFREKRKRVAIFVSMYDHCLWELLLRHRSQDLDCDIPLILSNHPNVEPIASAFQIPFHLFPVTPDTKLEQEERQLKLLEQHDINVVVLARYMQVLSEDFLDAYPDRVINIHHSFLPAFSGGRAYHQAHERGVKLIGATAHYATRDLDEGPIIEQDVIQVSHRDELKDYIAKGRILEKNVLVRALQAHVENRTIVYNNKCVVFGD